MGVGRDGSLSLSQGPTTVLGHLSCQELKAFTKPREGHLKGQESSEEPGGHERAEKASQGGECEKHHHFRLTCQVRSMPSGRQVEQSNPVLRWVCWAQR